MGDLTDEKKRTLRRRDLEQVFRRQRIRICRNLGLHAFDPKRPVRRSADGAAHLPPEDFDLETTNRWKEDDE